MSISRDDLHLLTPGSGPDFIYRKATDSDLAAMGYVKLDVDELRDAVDSWKKFGTSRRLVKLARQVLAALDGEEHTHGVVQQWCDECGELDVDDPDVAALDGEET